ncbi:hypothetical protein QL285_019396 [Trifolium repens]|nr:hypothetical protein QL285_019396 [Trifolium repens]
MAATIVVAKNTSYDSDINCCCEILVMAATLIVLAKLFATALLAATCSNIFFAAKNTFCSNFMFLAATFVAAKNDISCSESSNSLYSPQAEAFFFHTLAPLLPLLNGARRLTTFC